MDSFYGGRRGISFELVKTYNSKNEMMIDFMQSSCTVAYGQYVSIDSTDEDRGNIYRRTSDLSNSLSGAVLVGKLAGKDGINSQIEFIPYKDMPQEAISHEIQFNTETTDFISGKDNNGNIRYKEFVTYDAVKNVYKTQYGIQFPYQVIDFTTGISDDNTVQLIQNESRPFYQSYTLRVPAALNGDSIKELAFATLDNFDSFGNIYINPSSDTVITKTNFIGALIYKIVQHKLTLDYITKELNNGDNPKELKLYEKNNDQYILTNDTVIVSGKQYYEKIQVDTSSERWCKLCDFTQINISYNNGVITLVDNTGTSTNVSLKMIDHLTLDENGIIKVYYQNGSQIDTEGVILNANSPIKWIKNIKISDGSSYLYFEYNDGTTEILTNPANSLDYVEYTDNGELYAKYTKPISIKEYGPIEIEDETINPKALGYYEINSIYFDDSTDTIGVTILDEATYDEVIANIIITNENNSDFYIKTQDTTIKQYIVDNDSWNKKYFNLISESSTPNKKLLGIIRSIDNIGYNEENGTITITYNTLNNGVKETTSFPLKSIDSIKYSQDLNNVIIEYKDGTNDTLGLALRVTGINFNSKNQLVFSFNDNTKIPVSKSLIYPETLQFNEETQQIDMYLNSSYAYQKIDSPPAGTNPKESNYYEYNESRDEYFLTSDTEIVLEKEYYSRELVPDKYTPISPPLNYVKKVAIDPNTYELLFLFSDPNKQGDIDFDEESGWKSLGVVKDNSGLFIDKYIDTGLNYGEYATIERAITKLNELYPYGYGPNSSGTEGNNIHACIAIGTSNQNKTIYGFDKEQSSWYFLGRFSVQSGVAADSQENFDEDKADDVKNLPAGGLWFVTETEVDNYDEDTQFFGTYWEDF